VLGGVPETTKLLELQCAFFHDVVDNTHLTFYILGDHSTCLNLYICCRFAH
jgi:hypothetical protein